MNLKASKVYSSKPTQNAHQSRSHDMKAIQKTPHALCPNSAIWQRYESHPSPHPYNAEGERR